MMTELQTLAHCLVLAKSHVSAVGGVLDLDLSDENDPVLAMQEVALVCRSALMNAAVRQGYLTRGMRDWALALCASDEAAFDTFCAKAGPSFAYLSQPAFGAQAFRQAAPTRAASDAEAAICAQLGLEPGALQD